MDHAVTWIGYDDSIAFDLNWNNTIEDEEKGAMILLNSWGDHWEDDGCIYVPYKVLIDSRNHSLNYYIRKDYKPKNVFRVLMDYNERVNLKLSIGISEDSTATKPENILKAHHFQYAGNSAVPMLGRWNDGVMHDEPMEFALDLTDLKDNNFKQDGAYTYFLIIETSNSSTGNGTVHELEVFRYNYNNNNYDSSIVGYLQEETISISKADTTIYIPVKVKGLNNNTAIAGNHTIHQKSFEIIQNNSNLQISGISKKTHFALYDIKGREISLNKSFNFTENILSISLKNIPKGFYLIKIKDQGIQEFLKLIR